MIDAASAPLVVVVAYRTDDLLSESLDSLGSLAPVVVVDNAGQASTSDIVHRRGATYVHAESNGGFAAGVNRAMRQAWDGRRDVLLLNPDARLKAEDVAELQRCLRCAPRCAAVGPQLVGVDGIQQRASWPMPSPSQVWVDALGLGRWWRGRRFVTGAVLMLRGEALAEIGGLDEGYFLYAEEADWQLRAQRAGWSVGVIDAISAQHVGGASSSHAAERERRFHASGDLFALRWYGRSGQLIMRLGAVVAAARRSLIGSRLSRETNRRALRLHVKRLLGRPDAIT